MSYKNQYTKGTLLVKSFLTHAQYNSNSWKKDCGQVKTFVRLRVKQLPLLFSKKSRPPLPTLSWLAFSSARYPECCNAKEVCSVIERLMTISNPTADQLQFLELLSTILEHHGAKTHPTPSVKVGELLAHLLESKGKMQAALAMETGISKSIVSEAISGKRGLSIANIKSISKYLNVHTGCSSIA